MMSNKRNYSSTWWALTIPCGWGVEEGRGSVQFQLPSSGSVAVSAMKKQCGAVTKDDVSRYARGLLDSGWTESHVEWEHLSGIRLLSPDQRSVERFYVWRNALLLVIVYVHGQQNGLDEADVLSTLRGMRILH